MKYREANVIQRSLRRSAAAAPMSWLYTRTLHRIDRFIYRRTRGRVILSSWFTGLPVVMLTTTGAKSGQRRTVPVIGVPDGDRVVVIPSNWGKRHSPAWYHNLRTHPIATVTAGGVSRRLQAREAVGDERERLWQRDLQFYPGRATYDRRAANRHIPVVVLAPMNDDAS